jgi:hypothetical protein
MVHTMNHFIVNHEIEIITNEDDRLDFSKFCQKFTSFTNEKKIELRKILKEGRWDELKKKVIE